MAVTKAQALAVVNGASANPWRPSTAQRLNLCKGFSA
jgi:hypothetical protein